jgi:beta-galactosidase
MLNRFVLFTLFYLYTPIAYAQSVGSSPREHSSFDIGWSFAFGHPSDATKDFNHGAEYFSYLAKTGYGEGVSAVGFDDRNWRKLDLPHDWAVEQETSSKGSFSHGSKAIGRNFPDATIGWYRKSFDVPSSDLGRRIHISFDGVFRNSVVWVNGHYLGNEPSGYLGFEYDLTDYLNYGGKNVITVRADATMEEGWFYEGAGIYRHVWLNKFEDVHVAPNGTFVSAKLVNQDASLAVSTTLINEGKASKSVSITQEVIDKDNKQVARVQSGELMLKPFETKDFSAEMQVANAKLWSLETPYLHKLRTTIKQGGKIVDQYETTFGIRTIRFDVDKGLFLNGQHVEIKGTNNHQDHAGVGSAMPDRLQEFRIQKLKDMGSNAYRASHNPPTPELLDLCDRMGMLVIDENRLMGTASTELNDLKRLIIRDRNHPSIISWSIGNEEWGIENKISGARIATTMQAYAKTVDSTRFITAAFSGGVGSGISNVVDVVGYNYISNKNTDEHHKKNPTQFSWGTEEGSTVATRGIYENNVERHERAAYDERQNQTSFSIEEGWKYYAARPYLAGMFIWTGFDYRGEPTPFGWPSNGSFFGMMDQCGFPKDNVYYLRSWWTNVPTIHILPHWNWTGKEGKQIPVWVYSNAAEVELFLNNKSLGRKTMERNSHLEWMVGYTPGTLRAVGYTKGEKEILDIVKTTTAGSSISLSADVKTIAADKRDIAIVAIDLKDKNGLHVPTADTEISFSIQGPAKIIGVGNGDPNSLEADKYLASYHNIKLSDAKVKTADGFDHQSETEPGFDDSAWAAAFPEASFKDAGAVKNIVYRGSFNLSAEELSAAVTFYYKSVGTKQAIYVNGKRIANELSENKSGDTFLLQSSMLHAGKNVIAVVATPLVKKQVWETVNTDPGLIQVVKPAAQWKRKLFSGYAQVIIQSTGEAGQVVLGAKASGLKSGSVTLKAVPVTTKSK